MDTVSQRSCFLSRYSNDVWRWGEGTKEARTPCCQPCDSVRNRAFRSGCEGGDRPPAPPETGALSPPGPVWGGRVPRWGPCPGRRAGDAPPQRHEPGQLASRLFTTATIFGSSSQTQSSPRARGNTGGHHARPDGHGPDGHAGQQAAGRAAPSRPGPPPAGPACWHSGRRPPALTTQVGGEWLDTPTPCARPTVQLPRGVNSLITSQLNVPSDKCDVA